LNFSETANTTFIVAINETGSGLPSTAKLTLNGAPYTMRIYNSNAICSSSLGAACPSGLPAGDYYATIEVTDIAGNTASAEWIFYVRKQPELRVSCGISGAPGDEILLSATNFPPNVEYFKIFLRQRTSSSINPTILSYEMEILEYDGAIIRTKTPDGVPPSDPFSPHGLPYIQAEMKGAYAGISVVSQGNNPFQVLQYPIDRDNVIYVANSESRDISIIDLTQGVSVATINSSYGLHAGGNHISQGRLSDIAMSHDGKYVYTLVGGEDIPEQYRKMSVIDTACNTVVSTIDNVSGHDLLLNPDGDTLYAFYLSGSGMDTGAHIVDAELAIADPSIAHIATVPILAGTDSSYTMDAREIVISHDSHYKLDDKFIADDPHNAVTARIAPGYYTGTAMLQSLTPDGRHLIGYWTGDESRIYVFDITNGNSVAYYSINGLELIRVHPDGKHLYAIKGYNLVILDIANVIANNVGNEIIVDQQLAEKASNLMFSNDGSQVFVVTDSSSSQENNGSILIVDHEMTVQQKQVVEVGEAIAVGNGPTRIAIQPLPAPEIHAIEPDNGYIGDIVTITGANFSPVLDQNIVLIGSARAEVVESIATGTVISVRIPTEATSSGLTVARLSRVSNSLPFNVNSPMIHSISSDTFSSGETVLIMGAGFSDRKDDNIALFNDVQGEVIIAERSTLTVVVPFRAISGELKVNIGGKASNAVLYTILSPSLSIQSPINGSTFGLADDMDGNDRNGVQINVEVLTDLPDYRTVNLTVYNAGVPIDIPAQAAMYGTAVFSSVTVYPPETTIKAYYLDQFTGEYAEATATVIVDLPDGNSDDIVFTCAGPCNDLHPLNCDNLSDEGSCEEDAGCRWNISEAEPVCEAVPDWETRLFVYNVNDATKTLLRGTEGGDNASWRADGSMVVYSKKSWRYDPEDNATLLNPIWDNLDLPYHPFYSNLQTLHVNNLNTQEIFELQSYLLPGFDMNCNEINSSANCGSTTGCLWDDLEETCNEDPVIQECNAYSNETDCDNASACLWKESQQCVAYFGKDAIQGIAPSWSPDGRKIAYFKVITDETGFNVVRKDLMVIGVDDNIVVTSSPQLISKGVKSIKAPRAIWSSNSRYLLFAPSDDVDSEKMSLATVDFIGDTTALKTSVESLPIQGMPMDWIQSINTQNRSDVLSYAPYWLTYTNIESGPSIPVYPIIEQTTANSWVVATADPSGRFIAYCDNALLTIGNSGRCFYIDLVSNNRTFISEKSSNPSWLKPIQHVYHSNPPIINHLVPSDGEMANTNKPVISAIIKDFAPLGICGISAISMHVDSNNVSSFIEYDHISGYFKYASQFEYEYLQEIHYLLSVEDCAGNTSSKSGVFTINDPPAIKNIVPPDGSFVNTEDVVISAEITDSNGLDISSLRIEIDGVVYPVDYITSLRSISLPVTLREGVHSIKITATDIHEHTSIYEGIVTVDVTLPILIETAPDKTLGYYYTNINNPEISFYLSDNIAFDTEASKYGIMYYNRNRELIEAPSEIEKQSYAVNGEIVKVSCLPSFVLEEERQYSFKVVATDRAGNEYDNYNSSPLTIVYDSVSPSLSILRPLQDEITNERLIQAKITDRLAGVKAETVLITLQPDGGAAFECGTSSGFSYVDGIASCEPSLQYERQYTLTVYSEDKAGNVATATRRFTYSAEPADVSIIENLSVTPAVFNPRIGEQVAISLTLSKAAEATVDITPIGENLVEGEPVRTLTKNCPSAGECIIIWDGLDTTGALAPDAAYKFIARSRHIETNALYTYEPLDPPKLIVQIPEHPDTASFDVNDNLEIEYSINVSSMVIIEISDKNGEYVDRPVFWSPRAAGSNADIWNGRKGDEALVTESGEYPYVVVGFALPQNSTILAGGVPIVTIPHLQLVSLNAQLSETFNTTVSLSEPCFLDVSIINVDGSQYRSLIQNEYSSNLERQIEFTVTEELFPDPGFYSLKIEAIDSDGNRSKAAYINFAVIAPHVVTLNDNLYIAIPPSYQIQSIIQDGTTAMDDIQRFSEVGNLAFFAPIPDTSPGEHTFEITFLDKASSKTVILNKVIKFLGPLKLALENAVFNPANEETLTISYELKYDDTVGAAVFRTNADGSPVQINNASAIVRLLCDKCPISAGSQEISWDGKDNAGLLVPAGEYRIVVYAFTPGKEYSKVYIETADVTVEN